MYSGFCVRFFCRIFLRERWNRIAIIFQGDFPKRSISTFPQVHRPFFPKRRSSSCRFGRKLCYPKAAIWRNNVCFWACASPGGIFSGVRCRGVLFEFVVCGDLEKVGVHSAYGVKDCCVNADGHCRGTFFHRPYRCATDARPFGCKCDRNFPTHACQTNLFSHLFKDFTSFR